MRTLIVWGAGRIGRGFVAPLFLEGGWRVVFVDIDKALVQRLNARGQYTIIRATADGLRREVIDGGFTALDTDSEQLGALFCEDGIMLDIAVHEPKIAQVADMIAPLVTARAKKNPTPFDIMMNVNMAAPDRAFTHLMRDRLDGQVLSYFNDHVGVTGIAAMCISPLASQAELESDPLTLVNNGWHEQAIGERELKGVAPECPHIRLSPDVHAEETRKLYTLNMAHAMCCYLGVKKGYRTVIDVMKDADLRQTVMKALDEASLGLEHAFGFDKEQMRKWPSEIIKLLDNPFINDDLNRLGADTRRKLGRTDRLCGPALLCLGAGGTPTAIARGLRAGYDFRAPDPGTQFVQSQIEEHGLSAAIQTVSALKPNDPLFKLIVESE
ncbi:MAG: hypothetical protein IJJ23_04370 [Clostridia bacterium]|nr:hypothetical protein [Clostridia bacterium]